MPFGGSGFYGAGMPGGMPSGGRSYQFSMNTGDGPFRFTDPDNLFAQMFPGGLQDPMSGSFQNFASGLGGGIGGGMPRARMGSRFGSSSGPAQRRPAEPEVTVVERPLPVSLEEIFKGTTKKMMIKRKTYDQATGKQSTEDRILEVPIKRGLKAGSKIKFSDVGDQVEGGTQDLHFVVSEVGSLWFVHWIAVSSLVSVVHLYQLGLSNASHLMDGRLSFWHFCPLDS